MMAQPVVSADASSLADRILDASASRKPIAPITEGDARFDLTRAYAVSAEITKRREARGERRIGWKIGFTNAALWAQQGLNEPIWGPMYDTTVDRLPSNGTAEFSLDRLLEPRIEPEIGLRLARVPSPAMQEAELIECIDAVTHGFEIVQSVYPGWTLKPADAVAAFGMHGGYRHGELIPIAAAERAKWLDMLRSFTVILRRDGQEVDRGVGTSVLGGPLSALRHFVSAASRYADAFALRPGDLITTGTLTKAMPVAAGETWSTEISGIPLMPIKIAFR